MTADLSAVYSRRIARRIPLLVLVALLSACAVSYQDSSGRRHVVGFVDTAVLSSGDSQSLAGDVVRVTSVGALVSRRDDATAVSLGYMSESTAAIRNNALVLGNPNEDLSAIIHGGEEVKGTVFKISVLAILTASLQACQNPDRALFVTTTRIGVGYDAATTSGHVGYERAELYIGPDYPKTGAIPPVAASLRSDLAFVSPSVSQLYATGAAAEKVTSGDEEPGMEPGAAWDKAEKRKVAIVGTHTHVGLVARIEDTAVSQLDFGYGREEASLLPLRHPSDQGGGTDIYPSTLAAISVQTGKGGDAGLGLSQFIATGGAARNLAVRSEFKKAFSDAATEAKLSVEYVCDDSCAKIRAYVNANPSTAPDLVKTKCLAPNKIAFPTDLYFFPENAGARSKCVQALGIM